jgi:hypothetical protein
MTQHTLNLAKRAQRQLPLLAPSMQDRIASGIEGE